MAGHPLLQQVSSKTEMVSVENRLFHIQLSFHKVAGINGMVAGLKFTDQSGSMDAAKRGNIDPFNLGRAIAHKAVKMLEPELNKVTVLGFYLLTDDLAVRDAKAVKAKTRLYNARAVDIHNLVKHKLPHITRFEVDGGVGWAMSENDFNTYEQFTIFENELAKQIRISPC